MCHHIIHQIYAKHDPLACTGISYFVEISIHTVAALQKYFLYLATKAKTSHYHNILFLHMHLCDSYYSYLDVCLINGHCHFPTLNNNGRNGSFFNVAGYLIEERRRWPI